MCFKGFFSRIGMVRLARESLYRELLPSKIKKMNAWKNRELDELVEHVKRHKETGDGLEPSLVEAYSKNSRVIVLGVIYGRKAPVKSKELKTVLNFNLDGDLIALLDRQLIEVVDHRGGNDLYVISKSGKEIYGVYEYLTSRQEQIRREQSSHPLP